MPALSNISTKVIDGVSYYLPCNNDEVIELVNYAIEHSKVICTRGAGHSIPLIKSIEKEKNRIYLYLGRMRKVEIDEQNQIVKVQGGCNLGYDPNDPAGISTVENSLVYQIHQEGFAFPDLGGITHQTVGGFLSTGASGSSLTNPFNEYLESITMVTTMGGTATMISFRRTNQYDTNHFFAAGLSLGLFGVIVEARFRMCDAFIIRGQEKTLSISDWPVDFFGEEPNKLPLLTFFTQHDFQRIIWWPQKGLKKVQVWEAKKQVMPQKFSPIPYEQLTGKFIGIPIQVAGGWLLKKFGQISWLIQRKSFFRRTELGGWLANVFRNTLVPCILRQLVTNGTVQFKDTWFHGLPMDNSIDERLIPVWLSELWFPIHQSPEIIKEFRDYFEIRHDGPGTFNYEIYPAKATEFWISPGYRRQSIRMDIFWFAGNKQDPIKDFFLDFWNQLDEYEFRSHWGKFIPEQTQDELLFLFPKMKDWRVCRSLYDPVNVFLNDYWKHKLHL